jgi:hypothetical protein
MLLRRKEAFALFGNIFARDVMYSIFIEFGYP